MKTYQVIILELPCEDEVKAGRTPRILFGPTAVIARGTYSAVVAATRKAGDELEGVDDARLSVTVKEFNG